MTDVCNSDSMTCKVVFGFISVLLAAIICGILKCFRERLKIWLEKDIGVVRKNRTNPCFNVSGQSIAPDGDERPVEVVEISTNNISHTRAQINAPNTTSSFTAIEVPGALYINNSLTTTYNAGTVHMSSHTVIQHSLTSQYQNPRQLTQTMQRIQISEHSDGIQNREQTSRRQRNTQTNSVYQQILSIGRKFLKKFGPPFLRVFKFFLMSMFLYDWCMDMILSQEYFKRKEFRNCILNLAPGLISVLFSIPFLIYIAKIHKELSCLSGLLLVVVSPVAKVLIYGWMVVFGEQSWYQRWYLHALTMLQLAEVCIEGLPQLIFVGDIFLLENRVFYKGIGRTEIWTMIVSVIAVSASITSVTTTLDREEDVRKVFDDILRKEKSSRVNEANYFENYEKENTFLWYLNLAVVFLGKSFEYIPRCIIYAMFAGEFGLKSLAYFIGVYLLLLLGFSYLCFKKININDKTFESLAIISLTFGAFSNLFFCYEWLFRLRWSKRYFFIRYYILFYDVNLVLGFCNMLSSGKIVFSYSFWLCNSTYSILVFFITIVVKKKNERKHKVDNSFS